MLVTHPLKQQPEGFVKAGGDRENPSLFPVHTAPPESLVDCPRCLCHLSVPWDCQSPLQLAMDTLDTNTAEPGPKNKSQINQNKSQNTNNVV